MLKEETKLMNIRLYKLQFCNYLVNVNGYR